MNFIMEVVVTDRFHCITYYLSRIQFYVFLYSNGGLHLYHDGLHGDWDWFILSSFDMNTCPWRTCCLRSKYMIDYAWCFRFVLFCFVSLQTLWYGKVVDETRTDQETEAIRACNELLSTDERIDISFIQVGDGTTLCRKKWYIDQYRFFDVFCWHSTASRLEINTSTNQFWMTHTIDHFLWKGHLMLFLCNLW